MDVHNLSSESTKDESNKDLQQIIIDKSKTSYDGIPLDMVSFIIGEFCKKVENGIYAIV